MENIIGKGGKNTVGGSDSAVDRIQGRQGITRDNRHKGYRDTNIETNCKKRYNFPRFSQHFKDPLVVFFEVPLFCI